MKAGKVQWWRKINQLHQNKDPQVFLQWLLEWASVWYCLATRALNHNDLHSSVMLHFHCLFYLTCCLFYIWTFESVIKIYWSLSLCFSRPSGGKHRHTVLDQQNRAWQNSQTMDEEIRHIDSLPWPVPSFTSLTPHWTSLYLSHPLVCQSTLTKCSGKSALLSPFLFHLPPLSPPLLLLLPSFIYLFCVKTKNKQKKTKKSPLFLVDLKASFLYKE